MLIIIANVHVCYCFVRVSLLPICARILLGHVLVCLTHERAAMRMRACKWRRQVWQAPRSGCTTKNYTGHGDRTLRAALAVYGMNVFVDAVGGTGCSYQTARESVSNMFAARN